MPSKTIKTAILGTGNIGSDLMLKILRKPERLDLALFAGIDPKSEGLARARELGVSASDQGIEAILEDPEIKIVFEATSARAHQYNAPRYEEAGITAIDLTPAAIGPYVVPPANLNEHLGASNLNMITCGGQATIPLVHAISQVTQVEYAEIVSTIASASAGPGTRQNIDEFTFTTSRGLEALGRAKRGKAIIILNPADPPIHMRNTIYAMPAGDFDENEITRSIVEMVSSVQEYVPGYRLKGEPILDTVNTPGGQRRTVTLLLEVEGTGDFLPTYAGNLDIMTASAWRVGQTLAAQFLNAPSATAS